ncbi:hypothetical protein BDZ91DRAFT_457381 [Kalaharituber pfeilii]|nr:hypothetical protein BDZ91DRAFT_457381 [Kalaharituber pfeilii]
MRATIRFYFFFFFFSLLISHNGLFAMAMAGQPYGINRCCGMKGAHKVVESALPRRQEDHLLFFLGGEGSLTRIQATSQRHEIRCESRVLHV